MACAPGRRRIADTRVVNRQVRSSLCRYVGQAPSGSNRASMTGCAPAGREARRSRPGGRPRGPPAHREPEPRRCRIACRCGLPGRSRGGGSTLAASRSPADDLPEDRPPSSPPVRYPSRSPSTRPEPFDRHLRCGQASHTDHVDPRSGGRCVPGKCGALKMRPEDVDAIAGNLQPPRAGNPRRSRPHARQGGVRRGARPAISSPNVMQVTSGDGWALAVGRESVHRGRGPWAVRAGLRS